MADEAGNATHEVWRQWVALVDPTQEHDGIQGYLKLSFVLLGGQSSFASPPCWRSDHSHHIAFGARWHEAASSTAGPGCEAVDHPISEDDDDDDVVCDRALLVWECACSR